MIESWWIILTAAVVVGVLVYVAWPLKKTSRQVHFARARREFHRHREWLEAKFIRLAASRATDGSPRWDDCYFDDAVAYVRNRNTNELSAFVEVTVAVDDFPGSPTDVAGIVSNVRVGTAVFRYDRDHWETDGRAILNLSPAEAIRLYRNDLEMIDQELAGRT
jgi:hypothetical protein